MALYGFGVLFLQADEKLIAQGKTLFQTRFVSPAQGTRRAGSAGLALKAPRFLATFGARSVRCTGLGPIIKVKMNDEYFIESLEAAG